MSDILIVKKINSKDLLAKLDITNKKFTLKLYKKSNFIVFKIQVSFFLHNTSCFKYSVVLTRK